MSELKNWTFESYDKVTVSVEITGAVHYADIKVNGQWRYALGAGKIETVRSKVAEYLGLLRRSDELSMDGEEFLLICMEGVK